MTGGTGGARTHISMLPWSLLKALERFKRASYIDHSRSQQLHLQNTRSDLAAIGFTLHHVRFMAARQFRVQSY